MRKADATVLLLLLVFAVGINYIDRGSLSVATTEISAEFSLDDVQMGWLFSAFFWSYALLQIGSGWLVDRYDVKWVYAVGFVIWSVATLLMGVLGGFTAFFILRLLLGAGESVAYPATSRIIVANYSESQRGTANALVDAASKIGPALSLIVGSLVVEYYGWRALFIGVGAISLLWLPPWLMLVPSQGSSNADPEGEAAPARSDVGFGQLLSRRELWGTSLGFFSLGYTWYFLISWLPAYLERERGFSKTLTGVSAAIPLLAMAASAVAAGTVSDSLIRQGASPTRVRRSFLISGFLLCAVFMFAAAWAPGRTQCVALLVVACAALGLYTSNAWAVTQTLAGPEAAGRWSGVQNAIGNLGGVVSPVLAGWLVKETNSFVAAFSAASAVLLAGVFSYVFLVPRVEPLAWNEAKPEWE